MEATETRVRIRGTKDGLTVVVGEGPWSEVLAELAEQLGRRPAFFRGGRVAVNVGPRHLSREALQALGALLQEYNVTLWAVWSASDITQRNAADLGLETGPTPLRPVEEIGISRRGGEPATIMFGPLRSGQRVYEWTSIVIVGDVHPGAEIVSGGNIVVWGRLQGLAHAGAPDRTDVFIAALIFAPTQVRIGPYVAQGEQRPLVAQPEIAFVEAGRIVVEPWSGWRRRTANGWLERGG